MQTVLRFSAIYCLAKRSYMGYSRKNPNKRGWGHNFWKKTPGIFKFRICHFTLGNSRQSKMKLHPSENSTKLYYSHWKFQGQKPRPMEFHVISNLDYPSKFLFFLYWPQEFPHSIYSVPLEIPCPQAPCLDFFVE